MLLGMAIEPGVAVDGVQRENAKNPNKAWVEPPDCIKCPMTEFFSIPANRNFGLLLTIRALLQNNKC
jgi:hypothetical protein